MSPERALALALLVALAGCTGVSPGGVPADGTTELPSDATERPTDTTERSAAVTADGPTTASDTTDRATEPHTGVGTSHAPEHLSVRASVEVANVTVTLAPDGDSRTYRLDGGERRDLTREIHDRGHDVRVVVERGNETVFDQPVYGYESYAIVVEENDTQIRIAEV